MYEDNTWGDPSHIFGWLLKDLFLKFMVIQIIDRTF